MIRPDQDRGFALITALTLLVVLMALLSVLFTLTATETSTSRASADGNSAFFAAEAGLNVRGQDIRETFEGYNRPSGVSPLNDPEIPCDGSNVGIGDFQCVDYSFGSKAVSTYVTDDTPLAGPDIITIPQGELFAGLNAQEYTYTAFSVAEGSEGQPGAILGLRFRSRLVPLFQFAAFYDKDLEILPGPPFFMEGPIHVNGDLYLNANDTQDDFGMITVSLRSNGTGGDLYRGRKDADSCGGQVRVAVDGTVYLDPGGSIVNEGSLLDLPCQGSSFNPVNGPPNNVDLSPWNNRIRVQEDNLTIPPPEEFLVDGAYWDNADLRIVLNLTFNDPSPGDLVYPTPRIEVRNQNNDDVPALSSTLQACARVAGAPSGLVPHDAVLAGLTGAIPYGAPGTYAVEASSTFFNNRENRTAGTSDYPRDDDDSDGLNPASFTHMLEVDLQSLLTCIGDNPNLLSEGSAGLSGLGDTTEGGLLFYLSVEGPISGACGARNCINNYGVRVYNGGQLESYDVGDPDIQGLSIVSDQAAYVAGHFNNDRDAGSGYDDWFPAAVMTDTVNLLSSDWLDVNGGLDVQPDADDTVVNTAFLHGTDTTGGTEGTGGQNGSYNGGLENFPRFHESWTGNNTLRYRGSFVSLSQPMHVNGLWGNQVYTPPRRDWGYDIRFNNAANLPPMSPRFVYLKQQLFTRDFAQ